MRTTGLEPQWESWPDNVSNWHHRCDPTGQRPWVPSPEAEFFPLPAAPSLTRPVVPNVQKPPLTSKEERREARRKRRADEDPFRRKSSKLSQSLVSFIRKRLFGKNDPGYDRRCAENWPFVRPERHAVRPAEWRAYGYWARPRIGDVIVRNATPPSSPRDPTRGEIEDVFRLVQDVCGEWHPEKWVPRVEHAALPPRPALWPTPSSSTARLPATDLQLNPYLRHRQFGRPPILFDMRMPTVCVGLGERAPAKPEQEPVFVHLCPSGADGAQPATYPPVSELYISCLADDNCDPFPWPVLVVPHHPRLPVMVMHVLDALVANFEELMTRAEFDALSSARREQVARAYYDRVETMMCGRIPGEQDGLRRVDYLGERAFFRGLEPSPDGNGFILFVGPAY